MVVGEIWYVCLPELFLCCSLHKPEKLFPGNHCYYLWWWSGCHSMGDIQVWGKDDYQNIHSMNVNNVGIMEWNNIPTLLAVL